MKKKHKINPKLLKYPLEGFNYSKKGNTGYSSMWKSRLLANYLWNEYKNLDLVTTCLLKYSKQRIFNIIQTDLAFLIPQFEKEYQLDFNSSDKHRILKFEKEPRICPNCSSRVIYDNRFCSVNCANLYKSKDEQYLSNLSNGVKDWYKTADKKELQERHDKIKITVNSFNSSLTSQEKKDKYINKTLIYDSYENRKEQFNHLKFLFTEEFYYSNKYLPVECSDCGHKWEMTKSTGICRIVCRKCNPYKKGKTQAEIFNYMNRLSFCKMNNKSFLEDRKEIDILCDEYKLAVEYNGLLYHSFGKSIYAKFDNTHIDAKYHLRKTEEVESNGYKLFHIFENEWIDPNKKEIWKSMINNSMNSSDKIYARKCEIKEISYSESSKFLTKNHMQGNCNSSIKIGLFYNGELVSVMTFRKHKDYEWEIARFANKLYFNVIGGASKLLKHFEKNYAPNTLLSYANRRWSQGKLYETLGFKFIHNTAPNNFFFKPNENILYPREMFQKHKLKNILENYDENISAFQNMFNNDYRVIYDSGNKKYVKYYKS